MSEHPLSPAGYDATDAVQYHYGKFPPKLDDHVRLMKPLSNAASALARYDQMLKSMHSSDILLAPLRSQEAVISSRMEGTVSTLTRSSAWKPSRKMKEILHNAMLEVRPSRYTCIAAL